MTDRDGSGPGAVDDRFGPPGDDDAAGSRSRELLERAGAAIPGGAQTGLRAEAYDVGPVAFEGADGATLRTVDGAELVDYHLAFGPVILGHRDPDVLAAVREQLDRGVLYGAAVSEPEVAVAERLIDLVPSVETVNFCNSGSEATYHAIRLARAATGARKILKFEGCYHGWHDYLDVSVSPPIDAVGEQHPESAGMLADAVAHTIVRPFNDPEAAAAAIREHADDLAAVILEPVPHSVGCIRPDEEFLATLREETLARDVPLVFDEVITAFRHATGGMQAELDVTPDLTCMAKAMGNGHPVAAVGGRADLMAQAAGDHDDGVVISGTYSGHPLGVAAAGATLRKLDAEDVTGHVSRLGDRLREGLAALLADHDVTGRVVGYRSIFAVQFGVTGRPRSYADVVGLDEERFRAFAAGMRDRGHFFTPNPYKRGHVSLAHTDAHVDRFLDDADAVLASL